MARKERMRYWKVTAEETDNFDYDESKLLNWEIKCIREPEEEAHLSEFSCIEMEQHMIMNQ